MADQFSPKEVCALFLDGFSVERLADLDRCNRETIEELLRIGMAEAKQQVAESYSRLERENVRFRLEHNLPREATFEPAAEGDGRR